MHHSDAIRTVMAMTGATQKDIAQKIGARSQSVVSERINHSNIGLKSLLELLDTMGYEIVVRASGSGDSNEGFPIRLSDYQQKKEG